MSSFLMNSYARADIVFEKGEGVYIYDTTGRRYLDFAGGVAALALGHCHPHLVHALESQGKKLWHCSNFFRIKGQEEVAERLVRHTFADAVFFNNSGAEAVDCGLKLVRKFFKGTSTPERYRVITMEGAFHGRSLGCIAASGGKNTVGFEPIVDGFDYVPFGDIAALRAAVRRETAAILIEPIQGDGGIRPAPLEYLRQLRAVADEQGLLLFFDEVQTGMGRTGRLFAYQWSGIEPDILAAAKGLGAGFPVGACLATARVAAAITPGSHGSTMGGNPLAMAVANAVLDVLLEEGFLEQVYKMSQILWNRLREVVAAYPRVLVEMRGAGLMLGFQCAIKNDFVIRRWRELGLLTAPAHGNVARLLPPLIIEEHHVNEAAEIIERGCREIQSEFG